MNQCDWNNDQRIYLVAAVYNNDGHNPSPGQFKVKWEKILSQLERNIDLFGECKLPNWLGIHKEYKALKAEVIKKYNIDFTGVEHLEKPYTQCQYDWETTLLEMERERYIKFSVYPTDEARKKWIALHPHEFSLFVSLAFIINLLECIVVGYNPDRLYIYYGSLILLGTAIVVFCYGFCRTLYYFPTFYPIQPEKYWIYLPLIWLKIPLSFLYLLERIRLNIDREAILESFCYVIAIFFYSTNQPGLAALRIFRMFRFFSYFKYIEDPYVYDELPPEWRPFSPLRAGKLCAFYIEQLFQEFFTQKSLGGVIVLIIFFFTAYIVAVVLAFTKKDIVTPDGQPCFYLRDCYLTMIRLILYDGNGFNLLQQLADEGDIGMVFLLFILMIFNGIILINGLIGIFGQTFTTTDEEMLTLLDRTEVVEEKLHYISHTLKVIMYKLDGDDYDSIDKESLHNTSILNLLNRKDYSHGNTSNGSGGGIGNLTSAPSFFQYSPFRRESQEIANQKRSHPDTSIHRTSKRLIPSDLNININNHSIGSSSNNNNGNSPYRLDNSSRYTSVNKVYVVNDVLDELVTSPPSTTTTTTASTNNNNNTTNNDDCSNNNNMTTTDLNGYDSNQNKHTTTNHVTFSAPSSSSSSSPSSLIISPTQQTPQIQQQQHQILSITSDSTSTNTTTDVERFQDNPIDDKNDRINEPILIDTNTPIISNNNVTTQTDTDSTETTLNNTQQVNNSIGRRSQRIPPPSLPPPTNITTSLTTTTSDKYNDNDIHDSNDMIVHDV